MDQLELKYQNTAQFEKGKNINSFYKCKIQKKKNKQ